MNEFTYKAIKEATTIALAVVGAMLWIGTVIVVAAPLKGLPAVLVIAGGILAPLVAAHWWAHYNLERIRKLEAVKDKFRV